MPRTSFPFVVPKLLPLVSIDLIQFLIISFLDVSTWT